MRYLRTNTATRITVGPFLDKTDGITPEVAITVTSEKLTFVVDTAGVPTLILDTAPTASGGANDMVHITGDDSGFYDLELATADVNYLGRAMLSLNDVATHLPVFHEFMILPAVIYDAMILGTDLFDVSMTQILDTAVSTPATAGILDINVKNIANAVVNTATAQIGTNTVSQDNIDFGVLQKASLNAATPASVVGAVGSVTGNVGGSVASVTGAVGSVTGAVGSVTGNVGGNVTGSVGSVVGNVGGSVNSVTSAVTITSNSDITAIKTNTDKLQFEAITNYLKVVPQDFEDVDTSEDASLTAGKAGNTLRMLHINLIHKLVITEATGSASWKKADDSTEKYTATITSSSGSTTRTRMS